MNSVFCKPTFSPPCMYTGYILEDFQFYISVLYLVHMCRLK